MKKLRSFRLYFGLMVVFQVLILAPSKVSAQDTTWIAPIKFDTLSNPLAISDRVLAAGNNIYSQLCAVCHGNNGAGDGITAAALQPKPANFRTALFQNQSDGTIYFKISDGRPPMPPFKSQLSDQQIWAIIHYLRSLEDSSNPN